MEYKVSKCIRCGNSEFSEGASFCKKCGAPLTNYCIDNHCDAINVPDAVYCERCGSRTVFAERGLLEDPYAPEPEDYIPF